MKIGLCLSGGGARGSAHIGVLEALKEFDVYPDVVSGASAGALVGALYCAGKSKEEMLAFTRKGSLIKAFKFGIPDRGLGSLNFLKILLEKHIDQRKFEDLDRKLFVTATNLLEGKAEVFSEGELINPLLASCAIPVAFSPIEFNNQVYVDGGTMDNFPIDPLHDCDYIIGVNLLPRVKVGPKSVSSFRGVMARSFDLSILGNSGNKLGQTNITIAPIQLNKFGIFNFGKADELYEVGYKAALKVMDVISENLASIKSQAESS